ncbi:MAG: TetR/AcrR family transcriptional regulator [Sulfobacillus thermosulfidooxidans]|uniref:TetR family transcriptional regulator n=1 Tax=Sulfobacillus thermotolerans TaxID=338644 RepID=A0ABM6RR50_9FIRM|nr:TetR/AcrR family transcriptional regulator [Sulfobacillus sp. hq2]AUW93828.1 TetR family transcriptional regulator [Sulfobacillus thermotolerans]MCY0908762.1 TetR/AcrR family transcriptional regulator [Sulfobacillus thermotolerans]POB11359.1 TetR family transcriptional regulator [Sulfobacillus sp. hq2]PSR36958.1 MAG: TetR/AcrR family transcriptional regulator [Sulfobacillus thermosulfidooxidans]
MARPSKKSEIVQAAAELFSTKGFKATTVRDIAERAGVLSGSLYAHIDTKEDLLIEIVRQAANEFAQALAPIVQSQESPTAKMRAAVHAHLGVIASSRAWSTVYLDEDMAFSETGRATVRQLRRTYEQYWIQLLEEGQQQHVFSDIDIGLTKLFILSALNGFHRWYDPKGRLMVHEIADHYADMILKMLA